MIRRNRPYSANCVCMFYQTTMRRNKVEEAFQLLVTEGVIVQKDFGKAKVFLVNQDRFPAVDPEALEEMDAQIKERREKFMELDTKSKELDKELKDTVNSLTNK